MVFQTNKKGFWPLLHPFIGYAFFIIFVILVPVAKAQTVFPGEFQRVKTLGDVKVELIESRENKAEYNILRGFEKDLEFSVKDDLLTIRVKAPANSKYNRPVTKASVKLYYKQLREIQIAAMSEVSNRDTLVAPFLKLSASKGALGRLMVKSFELSITAQNKGTIYLSGKTETIKVHATSNSVVEADYLISKEANVTSEQGARVSIFCEKSIVGKAGTGSTILCKGNPLYKNVEEEGGNFKVL